MAAAAAWPVGFYLYYAVFGETAAPDTFSIGSWTLMLLPPAVLAIPLILGLLLRMPHPSRGWLYASRASAVILTLALIVACLFSLLYFFGELFDYAIG